MTPYETWLWKAHRAAAADSWLVTGDDLYQIRGLIGAKLDEINRRKMEEERRQKQAQRDYEDRQRDNHHWGCSGPG